MRLCIEQSDKFDPFYLNELLSFLGEKITEYTWIFSDIQSHIFLNGNEVELTEFENENFTITGEELDLLLKKYNILIIFGVIICVNKNSNFSEVKKFPSIVDNESYWSMEYVLSSDNIEMEFGLFDTTVVIVTSQSLELVNQLKKNFGNLETLDVYLEKESYQ